MDYEFRDPMGLARAVRIALVAWLVAMSANAAMSKYAMSTIDAFRSGTASQEDLQQIDAIENLVAIPALIIVILTAVLVAIWIYRVNKNAHALSDSMEMTPGWNVGFFFIPILHLWRPLQGILQTWRASASPHDAEQAEVPGWIFAWWASWIVGNILSSIATRISLSARTLDDFADAYWFDLLTLPIDLFTGTTLFLLVTRLSVLQHRAHDAETQEAISA